MRKGSKKPISDTDLVYKRKDIHTIPDEVVKLEEELFEKYHAIFVHEINPVQDILIHLCDACHEMDTRTEPWASIRKDIENLR